MDEPVKKPRGRPKKEEAEKRPVGRPKKEKPAEEPTEPKRGRGRPKKAPEEKAVRKSRAKPKEPKEPEVGKVIVRETAVTHPAGSGEPVEPPRPPPTPAVLSFAEKSALFRRGAKAERESETVEEERKRREARLPKDVKTNRKVGEALAFKRGYEEEGLPEMTEDQEAEAEGEFVEAQEEDPETDPFPFWEEVATKYGVRNPLPIPVPEERPDMKMKRRYAIRERYTKYREEGRARARKIREEKLKKEEAVRTEEEKEREKARQYETFRDSFRTPTAYKHWEKRMLDEINKNYNPGSGIPSDEKAFFLVLSDAGVPALAELSFTRVIPLYNGGDWSKLKQSDRIVPDLGIKHIGYLGSGDFKNEEQYDRLEALRLRMFPPEEEAERMKRRR